MQLSNLYNQNLFSVNPGAAGHSGFFEAFVSHREQWTGISGAPSTTFLNGSTLLKEKHGVGLSLVNDRTGIIKRLNVSGNYAYRLKLGEDHNLAFGVGIGFVQNSVDYADAIIDQTNDLAIPANGFSAGTFNADFGIHYRIKKLRVGVAIPQLLNPEFDYTTDNNDFTFVLERHLLATASYDISLNDDWSVMPSVMIRTLPSTNQQIDLGATVGWKHKLWASFMYREEAGLVAGLGFSIADRLSVGYAYEFSGSGIAAQSNGSHEFMLGFQMREKEDKPDPIVDRVEPVDTTSVIEEPAREFTYATLQLDPAEEMTMVVLNEDGTDGKMIKSNADGTFKFSELEPDRNYRIALSEHQGDDLIIYVLNDNGERVGKLEKNPDGTYSYKALAREEINQLPLLATDDDPIEDPKPTFTYSTLEASSGEKMKLMLLDDNGGSGTLLTTEPDGKFKWDELEPDRTYRIAPGSTADDDLRIFILNDNGDRVGVMKKDKEGVYSFKALTRDEVNALPIWKEDDPVITAMQSGDFYIVVGAFYTTERANRQIAELNDKGQSGAIATRAGSKWYFVSVQSFDQKDPAVEAMLALRKAGFPRAWVMVGK